ncbi:MAG TPA: OmpA family protein [Byssovorax sp.]|jgi:outer membrane protein OmpA-like peptidoglycan-associated protein
MRALVPARAVRAPHGSLRPWLIALALVVSSFAGRDARAQSATFTLDRLQVGGAPDDGIAVWRPHMGATTRFFGQLGVGFAANPLRLVDELSAERREKARGDLTTPVTTQTIAYPSFGVEIDDRVSLQAELPAIVAQTTNPTGDGAIGADDDASPTVAALMDARLTMRVVMFRTADRAFSLGADGSLFAPIGNRFSYASDGSVSGSVGLAAEVDMKRAVLVLNAGVALRPAFSLDDLHGGDEARLALGAFVPLRDGSIRLGVEVFGSASLARGATFTQDDPLEWLVEGRLYTDDARRGFVSLAGGTRVLPGYSPDARALAFVGYSFPLHDTRPPSPDRRLPPRSATCPDADHDGICDDVDMCPLEPEDHLPPNPDDGCPAVADDDQDGIPNAVDACPNAPGPSSTDPKKNGCPVYIEPPKADGQITLLKPIEFETAKATILPRSYPILDEVVKFLAVNPSATHLAIEGHTDNRGPAALNERLSDDRAHSVMTYLVEHGVAPGRLSAKGFGAKRPIADNVTGEGRQKNRRVDFRLDGSP